MAQERFLLDNIRCSATISPVKLQDGEMRLVPRTTHYTERGSSTRVYTFPNDDEDKDAGAAAAAPTTLTQETVLRDMLGSRFNPRRNYFINILERLHGGQDVNQGNDSGKTPLAIAAGAGDAEMCYFLMVLGADRNHASVEERRAAAMAARVAADILGGGGGGATAVIRTGGVNDLFHAYDNASTKSSEAMSSMLLASNDQSAVFRSFTQSPIYERKLLPIIGGFLHHDVFDIKTPEEVALSVFGMGLIPQNVGITRQNADTTPEPSVSEEPDAPDRWLSGADASPAVEPDPRKKPGYGCCTMQ